MHYFKKNIGDYAKKAGRLSMLQHGAYTLLMDSCYDREEFPTLDEAIEWTWASSKEEIEAVTFVLRKFFTLEDGVYVQKRIQEEIAEYHGKAETNKRIAIERETKRRANSTNRAPVVDEAPPNHKPLTINQEPITNNQDIPHTPQAGQKASKEPSISLQTYLEKCKSEEKKPIPVDDSVFAYAEQVGIPHDFLRLQWLEFKDRYSQPGAKRYKAWPIVFGKSVRGNWFKLWYAKNGQYELTTTGHQAKKLHGGDR